MKCPRCSKLMYNEEFPYTDNVPVFKCTCRMSVKCYLDSHLISLYIGNIILVWDNNRCSVRKIIISKFNGGIHGWSLIKEFKKDEIPYTITEDKLKLMLVFS